MDASFAQTNFAGGEISKTAQGRFDRQDYRTCMNVCFNGLPTETGSWARRPGTQYAGHSRSGLPAREIKFDFEQAAAYKIEFTTNWMRFRSGTELATTNDARTVLAISAANPAVVQTDAAHGWVTGNTVTFDDTGANTPLLQNRQFLITVTDTTHFSLQDALTQTNIDGATLGTLGAGTTVSRVQEVATQYSQDQFRTLRAIQAQTDAVLLHGVVPPQILQVATLPADGVDAQFSLAGLTFLDGPYLDPFTNGVQVTPNTTSGNITLTLSFPAYSATQAYKIGDFVTSSSVNYISLIDDNVNNTPVSSPSAWATTSASAALGPNGFQGSDVGRLVRLFSEPPVWAVATAYAAKDVVKYNNAYWTSLVGGNTGNQPGIDISKWTVNAAAVVWSWGRITGFSTLISGTLSGSASISNFQNNVANAFNGTTNQSTTSAASYTPGGNIPLADCYIGKDYSGASAQKIMSGTYYPASDAFVLLPSTGNVSLLIDSITINLRAKHTAPSSAGDGTLLGTSGVIANVARPVTIISSDQATLWEYVWFEVIVHVSGIAADYSILLYCAQAQFFNPPGTGVSTGFTLELLGPPLLYSNPIVTWRMGVYSDTTGYPTCGCYHEGRIWFGGAVGNRFDASVSNGIVGTTINFAPTDSSGAVGASSAISYTVNSDGVNLIVWMRPDLQGIIMGTQNGEWLTQAPSAGAMAANNIVSRRVTKNGCANVEPVRTENTNVFVQRYSRKLMEYFADVYSGKFSAPNLAKDAMHITKPGVAELQYQHAVVPVIWGRNDDGSIFGITYKRDTLTTSQGPSMNGWHRHALGSDRSAEGICVGPSVGGNLDSLSLVTNDAATGIRHIEVMTDIMEEGSTLAEAWYVDDAIVPTSTSSSTAPFPGAPYGAMTMNGLWPHNGKTVSVFAGGYDCGDFTVSNGSIVVPYGDGVSGGTGNGQFTPDFAAAASIVVGFTFTSQGQIVRAYTPAESGARNGPAFGKTQRAHQYAMLVDNTAGLSVGVTFDKMQPILFKSEANKALMPGSTASGIYRDTVQAGYSFDDMLCWQSTRPLPANIAALGPYLHTQDV